MLSDIERSGLKDLLKGLDLDDLQELARTSTSGVLKPSNADDAIDAILQHSSDVRSVLFRKKVSKVLLFKYLHDKNISFPGQTEKRTLIELVVQYWQDNSAKVEVLPNLQNIPPTQTLNINLLAVKFTEWFYNRINATISCKINGPSESSTLERLKEEDFWCDAKLHIALTSSSGYSEHHSVESATECLTLISDICAKHGIFFSPNLREEGLKGTSEPHGLVLVMNCGTLHSFSGSQCVGLYEQVFGLVKEPAGEHWKIKHSKLMLRSQEVNALPQILAHDQLSISNA